MNSASRDALVAMLSRLKNDLIRVNLAKPEQARETLQGKYPISGDYLAEVRRLCERGLEDGWLCPGEQGGTRNSRIAGSSGWFPFSIEAQILAGSGEAHGHPKGEVDLCWPHEGGPRYCGEAPGWVVFAPGSTHLPEATGGEMFVLSFRPDGAIDRDVRVPTRRRRKTAAKTATKAAPKRARTARARGASA